MYNRRDNIVMHGMNFVVALFFQHFPLHKFFDSH